jgi:hypothetical protein
MWFYGEYQSLDEEFTWNNILVKRHIGKLHFQAYSCRKFSHLISQICWIFSRNVLKGFSYYMTHDTANCHNPHNSSNWDSRITWHFDYKHTFYQNVVSTKNYLSLYYCKNITCLSVGLLRICQFFCLLQIVYQWVMTKVLFHEQYLPCQFICGKWAGILLQNPPVNCASAVFHLRS